ncbi:VOC family protein [Streptomyces sp. NPDC001698]|uniref:VOC family protein n=1 Tax=Streptomyces sp. NPDC001698 TaxID=3364601 RepID=UPI0036BAB5F4
MSTQQPFYHVGIIVPDIELAMDELARTVGLSWAKVVDRQIGDWPYKMAISRGGPPHLELLEPEPGGPWDLSDGPRLDHIGFWTEDVERDKRHLVDEGVPIEFDGCLYGRPISYHRGKHTGIRIELVDASIKPWFNETFGAGT